MSRFRSASVVASVRGGEKQLSLKQWMPLLVHGQEKKGKLMVDGSVSERWRGIRIVLILNQSSKTGGQSNESTCVGDWYYADLQ